MARRSELKVVKAEILQMAGRDHRAGRVLRDAQANLRWQGRPLGRARLPRTMRGGRRRQSNRPAASAIGPVGLIWKGAGLSATVEADDRQDKSRGRRQRRSRPWRGDRNGCGKQKQRCHPDESQCKTHRNLLIVLLGGSEHAPGCARVLAGGYRMTSRRFSATGRVRLFAANNLERNSNR